MTLQFIRYLINFTRFYAPSHLCTWYRAALKARFFFLYASVAFVIRLLIRRCRDQRWNPAGRFVHPHRLDVVIVAYVTRGQNTRHFFLPEWNLNFCHSTSTRRERFQQNHFRRGTKGIRFEFSLLFWILSIVVFLRGGVEKRCNCINYVFATICWYDVRCFIHQRQKRLSFVKLMSDNITFNGYMAVHEFMQRKQHVWRN